MKAIHNKEDKSTQLDMGFKPAPNCRFASDARTFVSFVRSFENTRAWMIYGMKNPEYAK